MDEAFSKEEFLEAGEGQQEPVGSLRGHALGVACAHGQGCPGLLLSLRIRGLVGAQTI